MPWVYIALCHLDTVIARLATALRIAFAGVPHGKAIADGSEDAGPCFPVADVSQAVAYQAQWLADLDVV